MSYILDALRRADAERERGAVPGLHDRSPALPAMDDTEAPTTRPAPRWLPWLIGLALLSVSALTFIGLREPAPSAPPPASLPEPVAATPPAAGDAAAPELAAREPMPEAGEPVLPPPASPLPPLRATPASPTPTATAPTPPAVVPPAAARLAPGPAPAAPTAATPTPAAPAAAPRVFALHELPEDIRRQLPSVQLGGSVYSTNASQRLLIVGGQLFNEGDMLGPELKIEEIRPRSAVLSFRGYRYELPH